MILLTICVIGRNEAANLPRLIESLGIIGNLSYATETIFVDSASTDNTVEVARAFFGQVYVLQQSPNLCASAARYVATRSAVGRWLLYLDGDMTLSAAFLDVLALLPERNHTQQGMVGICQDVYPDGTTRRRKLLVNGRGIVAHFGGAVLLPRELVLRAGNWNPAVCSNEEIDLYTRLREGKGMVAGCPVPMVSHWTERISAWRVVAGNLIPGFLPGKRCYGFGQILAARFRTGDIGNFVRWYPVPFLCWATLLGALGMSVWVGPLSAVLLLAAGWGASAFKVGWIRVLVFNIQLVHAVIGLWHYDSAYRPEIAASFRNSRGLVDTKDLTRF